VLAALAIYGVRKYVANAKTTEARTALGRLSKDATTSFNRENLPSAMLNLGTASATASSILCDAAGAAVPAAMADVQGKKYQSSPDEWKAGTATVGWA